MPCHPEDKAVNKAMKRTNKRLSQAKLHSESLDNDDDVTERRDEMDGAKKKKLRIMMPKKCRKPKLSDNIRDLPNSNRLKNGQPANGPH
jgi:hypothetical protein